jgi:hypothetical protein
MNAILAFYFSLLLSGVGMSKHWTKPVIESIDNLITKESWKKRYKINN